MPLSLTASFPKLIQIGQGSLIVVDGAFDNRDHIRATYIREERTGVSFQLHPDEITEVEAFSVSLPWQLPLVAQVLGCHQYGTMTSLSLFPTGQSVFNYNRLSNAWARAAAPAFWGLVDEARHWERGFIPRGDALWDAKAKRPHNLDFVPVATELHHYARARPEFKVAACIASLAASHDKMLRVERHVARLRILYNIRHHLYASSSSEGREFSLSETCQEAALTVEAAAATVFSSLDILSHALNLVYELGMPQSKAGFVSAVTGKKLTSEVQDESSSLRRDHAHEPATIFLLNQYAQWIEELAEWRHFVIHRGLLEPGEHVHGGVPIFLREDEARDARLKSDALELVDGWGMSLRGLLVQVFGLIAEKARRSANDYGAQPLQPRGVSRPDRKDAVQVLKSFLDLWQASLGTEPQKFERMFGRLSRNWKNEWKFTTFKRFVENHPLRSYSLRDTYSSSGGEEGEVHQTRVSMSFEECEQQWTFVLKPHPTLGHVELHLTPPLGVPLSFTKRLQIGSLERQQSGKSSGHRDMVFSVLLKNVSPVALHEVEAHIISHPLSRASASTQALDPGAEQKVEVRWEEAFVFFADGHAPPAGLLADAPCVRVLYRLETEEGSWWAEEFGMDRGEVRDSEEVASEQVPG
jgi:hypothetical protein